MKRGLSIYPKNIYRISIYNGKQDAEIFYAYSELTSIELTDYLSDNLYIILSNETSQKNTLIPTFRVVYVEEIEAKDSEGNRIYFYDGEKDYKCSFDSSLAYKLITGF